MNDWTRLLRSPEMVEDLYGDSPSLEGFLLSELRWSHQDKYFELRGTLAAFPPVRRPTWEGDANRLAIRLILEGVISHDIKGWGFDNTVTIEIEHDQEENTLYVRGHGEELTFEVICDGLDVTEIFAYHSPDPPVWN